MLYPVLDPSRCVPCGLCERACVEARYGPSSEADVLERRRIRIRDGQAEVCVHCEAAPCIAVCPHHALIRRHGHVDLLEDRCTGCGKCIPVCPTDGIRRVTELDIAVKCDGCVPIGGKPACAPACPSGALALVEVGR